MLSFHERDINELKKFTKSTFNLEDIVNTAGELKYSAAIKKILASEFESPSDDLVTFLTKQVYSGRMTANVKEQFTDITKRAIRSFMNDQINQRLKQAIDDDVILKEIPQQQVEQGEELDETSSDEGNRKPDIHTTEDEIEGFFAVKSILRDSIDVKRLHMRDTKSYCGILLDDNNRKPVARFHFNRTQWYFGIINADKNEERIAISDIDDIYDYADRIKATVTIYDS
jgi:hypothetical protein